MIERLKQTVRIVRRAKVETDERGRSVWVDPVETARLELVSTTMLTQILEADNEDHKAALHEAANGADGVLARDAESDSFHIIEDDELQAALDSAAAAEPLYREADVVLEPVSVTDGEEEELSLVSTQMLKQILSSEQGLNVADDGLAIDEGGGFDPYNSG